MIEQYQVVGGAKVQKGAVVAPGVLGGEDSDLSRDTECYLPPSYDHCISPSPASSRAAPPHPAQSSSPPAANIFDTCTNIFEA